MTGPRGMQIAAAVAAALAAVGLISGVESSGREVASYVATDREQAPASEARSYRDMRERAYGPNAPLPAAWWQTARAQPPPPPPEATTPEQRSAALARRAERRAYDGAPPTIPHPVDQRGVPACLVCHAAGLAVASMPAAPAASHARHDSCLQCHVVAADPRGRAAPGGVAPSPLVESAFVGLAPAPGERAWQGAPPTIPHPTQMRVQCMSCHGAFGAQGLRTPHPWRVSCRQCHAASAALDQREPKGATASAPAPREATP